MSINLTKQRANTGRIVYEWHVKEYEKYDRDRRWYWIVGLVGVILLAYSMLSANYLFALIVVLAGIILFMQDMQEPFEVNFAIAEAGIIIGNRFYPYSEIKNFYIVYNPPEIKSLYFITSSILKHRLQVPLLDVDPMPIRELLNKFVEEDVDKEEEPLTDRFSRLFKLH